MHFQALILRRLDCRGRSFHRRKLNVSHRVGCLLGQGWQFDGYDRAELRQQTFEVLLGNSAGQVLHAWHWLTPGHCGIDIKMAIYDNMKAVSVESPHRDENVRLLDFRT